MLHGAAQHELARVQHERVVVPDRDDLREPFAHRAYVYVRHSVVPEHQQITIQVQVHAGGLDAALSQRLDNNPTLRQLLTVSIYRSRPSGFPQSTLAILAATTSAPPP